MQKLLVIFVVLSGFTKATSAQAFYTVRNNTNCDIIVEASCPKQNGTPPCGWVGPNWSTAIPPGGVVNVPTCTPSPPGMTPLNTVLHFYFAPVNGVTCSVYDPFIAAPGVPCPGYPANDIIRGSCEYTNANVV